VELLNFQQGRDFGLHHPQLQAYGFSGFAAMLTEDQAKQLAGQVFPSVGSRLCSSYSL